MRRRNDRMHVMDAEHGDSARPITTAERRFAERAAELEGLDLAQRFARIYETDLWAGPESRSGLGSGLAPTEHLRRELPKLLRRIGVRRMLDVPCGDFHWMQHADLEGIEYIGGDIVPELVRRNEAEFGRSDGSRRFVVVDLTRGPLPSADLVLCRDCLVHLSYAHIDEALRVIRSSGARFLLTTTFSSQRENRDVADGDWRPLHLQGAPFAFPAPIELLVEECNEEGGAYADKSLGLWRVEDLPLR